MASEPPEDTPIRPQPRFAAEALGTTNLSQSTAVLQNISRHSSKIRLLNGLSYLLFFHYPNLHSSVPPYRALSHSPTANNHYYFCFINPFLKPGAMSEKERRLLPFASVDSPWYRRKSLLSETMIRDEIPSIYESHSFFPDSSSYTIISLKQGQGFLFNQDLFATPYQQLRALANERRAANERKFRAMSMSQAVRSKKEAQRRHTSHELRPVIHQPVGKFDSAIEDDSMDVEPEENELDLDDLAIIDEYEEDVAGDVEGFLAYERVKVADVIVDPDDTSFLPTEADKLVEVKDDEEEEDDGFDEYEEDREDEKCPMLGDEEEWGVNLK